MELKEKFEQERKYYPTLAHWMYLGHTSDDLYPSYSAQTVKAYLDDVSENNMALRGFTGTWDFMDEMRGIVAQMFHCKGDKAMYGLSFIWLFNIFINGIRMKEGDSITTTTSPHAPAPHIMLNKMRDGVEVRSVHPRGGVTGLGDIYRLVDEHTRAICLRYMENAYGFKHNLKAYREFCWKNDIWFIVDATQAAGAMRVDVGETKIDFLTISPYKWLCCILDIGFVYISEWLQKCLELVDTGWSCSADRWYKDTEHPVINEDARWFECGGTSVVNLEGVSKIINRHSELGADDMEQYRLPLVDYPYDRVEKELKKAKIYGNFKKENRLSIATLAMPAGWGMADGKVAKSDARAHCPVEGLPGIGFHFYDNIESVDWLVGFLKTCEQGGE